MQYCFDSNEFTTWDLQEYMKRAYGAQISGRPFTAYTIQGWQQERKIADAYGGHKILEINTYKELGNLRVMRVEHLNREDIEAAYGSLSQFEETLNKKRKRDPKKKKKKARTELYYQTLGKKAKKQTVIPDNYRELGIKENQFK